MSLPWISVNDRLPSTDEDVLIFECVFGSSGSVRGRQIYVGYFSLEDEWVTESGETIPPGFMIFDQHIDDARPLSEYATVTHWMPEEDAYPTHPTGEQE